MNCTNCTDLEERVRQLAASNRALVKECDFLRAKVLELGIEELHKAESMDMRLKHALTIDASPTLSSDAKPAVGVAGTSFDHRREPGLEALESTPSNGREKPATAPASTVSRQSGAEMVGGDRLSRAEGES